VIEHIMDLDTTLSRRFPKQHGQHLVEKDLGLPQKQIVKSTNKIWLLIHKRIRLLGRY